MTKNFGSEKLPIAICQHSGCVTTPLLNRTLCSKHYRQFKSTGFTWNDYQAEEVGKRKADQRGRCSVGGCEKPRSSVKSPICRLHQADRSRKRLPLEFYTTVMQRDSCEVCGSKDRLAIDHLHGHHSNVEEMCEQCVRGRICIPCNSVLGFVGDDAARLRALAIYLNKNRGA